MAEPCRIREEINAICEPECVKARKEFDLCQEKLNESSGETCEGYFQYYLKCLDKCVRSLISLILIITKK